MYVVKLNEAIEPEALPKYAKTTAKVFKMEPERMEHLLSGSNKQLTKPIPKEKAERMADVFHKLGVMVDVMEVPAEITEAMPPPLDVHTTSIERDEPERSRRSWPDIFLGAALLVLIAGIVATLLSGRSFLPFGPSNTADTQALSVIEPEITELESPEDVNPSDLAPGNQLAETQEVEVAVNPAADIDRAENVATTTATAEAVVVEDAEVEAASSDEVTELSPVSEPAEETEPEAITITSEAEPVEVDLNISSEVLVGEVEVTDAFASETVTAVTPEELSTESASQESAEAVTNEVSESEDDPELEANTTNGVTVSSSSSELISLDELSSGSYIQAGAYSSVDNAAFQKSTLEQLGFSVTNVQDFDFVVLMLGPFDEANLSEAVTTLNSNAVSHYVRNLP